MRQKYENTLLLLTNIFLLLTNIFPDGSQFQNNRTGNREIERDFYFFESASGRFEPQPQPSRENLECYP